MSPVESKQLAGLAGAGELLGRGEHAVVATATRSATASAQLRAALAALTRDGAVLDRELVGLSTGEAGSTATSRPSAQ